MQQQWHTQTKGDKKRLDTTWGTTTTVAHKRSDEHRSDAERCDAERCAPIRWRHGELPRRVPRQQDIQYHPKAEDIHLMHTLSDEH